MRLTDNPRRDVPICLGIAAFVVLLFGPATACGCGDRDAKATVCLVNLKSQALGLAMYEADHDAYPPRDLWTNEIQPYVNNEAAFHAPEFKRKAPEAYGYAFNEKMSSAKEPKHPERAILVYESTNPARNASDFLTSLPRPGRHGGKNNVAYADGHARRVVP